MLSVSKHLQVSIDSDSMDFTILLIPLSETRTWRLRRFCRLFRDLNPYVPCGQNIYSKINVSKSASGLNYVGINTEFLPGGGQGGETVEQPNKAGQKMELDK